MRYKDRDEFVSSLREFADFIEEKGVELPMSDYDLNVIVRTFIWDDKELPPVKQRLREIVKKLGSCEKKWSNGYLDIRRNFGKYVVLEFTSSRDEVCTKRVVGTKHHEAKLVPAYDEEIIEWDCDESLLR